MTRVLRPWQTRTHHCCDSCCGPPKALNQKGYIHGHDLQYNDVIAVMAPIVALKRLVDSQYMEELEKILFTFPKRNPSFVGDLVALLHFSCVLYSPYLLFWWSFFLHCLINDKKGTRHTLLTPQCCWSTTAVEMGVSFSSTVPFAPMPQ
ncbi:uncharacterized protein P174DRAFT_9714 [Aspergillus novofumigatus IBT 16806]|uniref:Uncharacterized protein n=1 Tax=Aspergillus novofumigatus (strain IBT 16806) TaxID=1392255 RepID=A0A2I1CKU2_ASPN1|nr:uncharacterized protein P174DRAFT_9714 [Aspergillus novofumigatus IBT 16806]PKX98247.1 hypothetical protein P174DRAFT_9714 [Aspergillus novofumigatus IBT 16806]